MVIKNSIYVDISHEVEAGVLLISWKKAPTFEQFTDLHMLVLEYVQRNNQLTAFCTDLSVIGPLTREQEAWLTYDYYPKVFEIIQADVNAAVVFSEAHFKAIVTNYQQPDYLPRQDFINFNYFTDFGEAMHWLLTIKKGQETIYS